MNPYKYQILWVWFGSIHPFEYSFCWSLLCTNTPNETVIISYKKLNKPHLIYWEPLNIYTYWMLLKINPWHENINKIIDICNHICTYCLLCWGYFVYNPIFVWHLFRVVFNEICCYSCWWGGMGFVCIECIILIEQKGGQLFEGNK